MQDSCPKAGRRSVSTVIIAQDEAERIAACVEAAKPFSDEIVVMDGGSRDETASVARSLGCRVIESPWPGYARQRNLGANAAAHDWIFWVDADERVGRVLAGEINRWKERSEEPHEAIAVKRVGDLMGIWLRDRPESQIRLYNRRHWGVREVPVHESVVSTDGRGHVRELPGTLWHHGFRSIHDHVERFNRYTTLDAELAISSGRRFSPWRLVVRPPARFVQRLVVQRGFRIGVRGLVDALLWSYYEIMVELKVLESTATSPPEGATRAEEESH